MKLKINGIVTTWEEFVRENPELMQEELNAIRHDLAEFGVHVAGGGAQAETKIEAIPE